MPPPAPTPSPGPPPPQAPPAPLTPLTDLSALLDALRALPAEGLGLSALAALARRAALCPASRAALRHPDPAKPYGRRVLFAAPHVECMVATWTPGRRCAVHDHGGASGVIRVLEGAGENISYQIDGRLRIVAEQQTAEGEVLTVGARALHNMGCRAGPGQPSLLTLHLYTPTIPHMIVYDTDETLIVAGECGAWVPTEQPELVRARRPGHWSREALTAAGIFQSFA